MKRMCFLCALAACLAGCAVGHGPLGEIVIGFKAGALPETAGQVAATGANAAAAVIRNSGLPFGLGEILATGLTTIAGAFAIKGGTAAARARAEAAELRGEARGWDEREKAAGVQAPLPGGAANG